MTVAVLPQMQINLQPVHFELYMNLVCSVYVKKPNQKNFLIVY